ncbi:MAG: DUF2752 domain-containing protein [Sphingobacteriaceae bacterium]|nr:DUF2752 domain-containing protein [Sphingobacteriaceae bacterium]
MKLTKHLELVIWVSALIVLAFVRPGDDHFTLCPLANLGFVWCPGCGLGRSIASIFQGDFAASFNYHWFGIPALLILLYRIITLSKKYLVYF